MKRITSFFFISLIFMGSLFAIESILIDFNELVDDFQGEHQATLVDFGDAAGTRYTEDEKAVMRTSLYLANWSVRLSESSRTVINNRLSQVLSPVVSAESTRFAGSQVLGIRVHYPEGPFNSYAWIHPPFKIPAYATSAVVEDAPKGSQFNGYGVLKNVGAIKSVRVNVYGMNYPMGMAVVLSDQSEETREIPMGYLDFDGWRELVWVNPNYISDIRNRELRKTPPYPREEPALTFDSLQFFRDASQEGGDFIVYVKDIAVTYDQAVIQGIDTDLNHEEIWGILAKREEERRLAELSRIGEIELLRYLESQRIHTDDPEFVQ